MKILNLLFLLDGIGMFVFMLLFTMLGPPIILAIIGFAIKSRKKKAAKVLFILASIYLVTGLGICFTLINAQ